MNANGGSSPGRLPVVLILFGTRPEAIKLTPVARALIACDEHVDVRVISTGQQDELLYGALASLDLAVDEDSEIMRPDQDLYDVGIECLDKLRPRLRESAADRGLGLRILLQCLPELLWLNKRTVPGRIG